MKKGIIAISLLLSGALFITPIAQAITEKDVTVPVKVEDTTTTEQIVNQDTNNDKTTQTEETNEVIKTDENITVDSDKNEPVKEDVTLQKEVTNEATTENQEEVEAQETGMSMIDAQDILNKYLSDVENADFTYTYQGDESAFEVMQEKGIRGYVFLPNIETDMAYLVDKDNGSIYYFHPSGYFAQLQ